MYRKIFEFYCKEGCRKSLTTYQEQEFQNQVIGESISVWGKIIDVDFLTTFEGDKKLPGIKLEPFIEFEYYDNYNNICIGRFGFTTYCHIHNKNSFDLTKFNTGDFVEINGTITKLFPYNSFKYNERNLVGCSLWLTLSANSIKIVSKSLADKTLLGIKDILDPFKDERLQTIETQTSLIEKNIKSDIERKRNEKFELIGNFISVLPYLFISGIGIYIIYRVLNYLGSR
jgi:hypothetical protein